jgi:hypothetical protein
MPTPQVAPHHRIAERIARLGRERGTLSHSLLIHGPVGAGQREVAVHFGQSLFCETGSGPFGACGECRNCRRVVENLHPDWIWIEPARGSKGLPNITMETIQSLQDRLVLEPYEGLKVVGCVFEAEKMKPETANSLLKLVEEPPAHAAFILVTEYFQRILPTIRSRCLHVPLGLPSSETLEQELRTRHELSGEEAQLFARYALQEGVPVEQALSESSQQLREEALELVDLAVLEGEQAFIPMLKGLKHDRETNARLVQFCRDLLRDCLLLAEGPSSGDVMNGFPVQVQSKLTEWARTLNPEALAELIDHSFEYEEAILGYASPVHSLATFLSEVRERA